MIAYFISTGEMTIDTKVIGRGYSGRSKGLNDPRMMFVRGLGPIPCGVWDMALPYDHPNLGPNSIGLSPRKGTDVQGRTGFFIHGDNPKTDFSASSGCIVLDRNSRGKVACSLLTDPTLYVFP